LRADFDFSFEAFPRVKIDPFSNFFINFHFQTFVAVSHQQSNPLSNPMDMLKMGPEALQALLKKFMGAMKGGSGADMKNLEEMVKKMRGPN
jgi:hypothetical protein